MSTVEVADDIAPAAEVHRDARLAPTCRCSRPLAMVDDIGELVCQRCGRDCDGHDDEE